MELRKLGENGLIRLLTAHWRGGRDVVVGVGDDCAVLRGSKRGDFLLYKTDAVVECSHFLATEKPALVGRKALARAVSDIAAMGGEPWAALVTIGVPKEASVSRLRGIYRGLELVAREYHVALVGGETTRAKELFLSISLLGRTRGYEPVLRSTARPGDQLFVTGALGGSIRGKHLRFSPRVKEGQWLARQGFVTAMMDLSDGLGADLPRLAAASKTGFRLEREAIPRARGVSVESAINDGEDYELLLAVSPRNAKRLLQRWPFALALTCIGALTKTGRKNDVGGGFDHFRQR